jgi:endonuclease/exonuclease/phosphatase family metal-dependent hydrolase
MHRREFLVRCGSSALCTAFALPSAAADDAPAPKPNRGLRTITYNVLKCHGFVPSESLTARRREPGKIAAEIARELDQYDPDIITFQEGPPEELLREMADQLGMQCCFFAGGWHGGVLTRYKIITSENRPGADGPPPKDLFTRHWGRATLDTGSDQLALYSAHLHPSDDAIRARELTEMLKVMAGDLRSELNLLFQGDLNHSPEGPEYARWVKAGLQDAYAVKGQGPPETFDSHKPYKRIDYVWAHGPIAARLSECRTLFERRFRVRPESPQDYALSDHLPVLATFV